MKISNEIPVGLKEIQKKYFYRKSKHVFYVKYIYH
jgi:hypothetical protein